MSINFNEISFKLATMNALLVVDQQSHPKRARRPENWQSFPLNGFGCVKSSAFSAWYECFRWHITITLLKYIKQTQSTTELISRTYIQKPVPPRPCWFLMFLPSLDHFSAFKAGGVGSTPARYPCFFVAIVVYQLKIKRFKLIMC